MTAYTLSETETFEITDTDGQVRCIYVSRPATDPPKHGYPVLTVLDGDVIFASFAEARRVWTIADPVVGNAMIVAIGYPDAAPYAHPRRRWDFTPPDPDPLPPEIARVAYHRGGGSDAFAEFVTRTLREELARRYPLDLDRQALFGHSLGGLFALRMLYRQPGGFRAIIAASPAQYWCAQLLRKEERNLIRRLDAGSEPEAARLLITVGGTEKRLLWEAEALAQRLETVSGAGLYCQLKVYPDEEHVTVPTRSITDALRFAFTFP